MTTEQTEPHETSPAVRRDREGANVQRHGLPVRRRARLGLAAILVALAGLFAGGGMALAAEVGSPAPDYGARALGGDRQVALADYEGEVRLVNLWATWCVPCVEEMPFIQELQSEYRDDGLRVIGVSIDTGRDNEVAQFLDRLDISFLNLRDPDNDFQRAFRTRGVPETVLLDREGELIHRWLGPLDADEEQTHTIVTAAVEGQEIDAAAVASIGLAIAFAAGLLSFLSPCVLPLVPTYLTIVTGRSAHEVSGGGGAKRSTLVNALLFVAGFSAIFIALGASASAIGQVFTDFNTWIARIGGVVVGIFGLHLLGVFRIPVLNREARLLQGAGNRAGRAGTFVIGMGFAAGWTPCIGPVLAAILTLSATSDSIGAGLGLLGSYSVGMAVPFLLAALLLGQFLQASTRIRRWLPALERGSGVLCLVIAALLLTGALERMNQWLSGIAPALG